MMKKVHPTPLDPVQDFHKIYMSRRPKVSISEGKDEYIAEAEMPVAFRYITDFQTKCHMADINSNVNFSSSSCSLC